MSLTIAPVVVDLGKEKSKTLRDLKKGEGRLVEEVARIVEDVRAKSSELADKELVPVVIVYRRKAKKSRSMMPFNMMK